MLESPKAFVRGGVRCGPSFRGGIQESRYVVLPARGFRPMNKGHDGATESRAQVCVCLEFGPPIRPAPACPGSFRRLVATPSARVYAPPEGPSTSHNPRSSNRLRTRTDLKGSCSRLSVYAALHPRHVF